jgi:hypothetical protein
MQILAAPFAGIAGDYQSIQTVTVGSGGQATVTFSSIPSTFKHLQIRGISRTATTENTIMRFNGDSTSSYRSHFLFGDGSSTGSGDFVFYTHNYLGNSTSTANVPTAFVIDILDYTSTNKNKTTRTLMGFDTNGAGVVQLLSGLWMNSASAVNQITLSINTTNFAQYSQFALYGIKG